MTHVSQTRRRQVINTEIRSTLEEGRNREEVCSRDG